MAGALKKIEEGVGTGATALTAKAHLVQAGDATAQAARVTGAAEAAKGRGLAGKVGKAAVSKVASSSAGRKVAQAAAARAPAAMPGLISKVASTPGLATAGKVVGGLARFAPWVAGANAAIGAVRGGYESYEKGGSALDVAKGVAWGAADQVTAGLASWAYGKGTQVAKGLGNAIVPAAQAQEAGVGKKSGWTPGQVASENRATSAEVDGTGVGAVDVAKGGYHPKALEFYGPADKALYDSRKTRGVQGTPMPGEGMQTPGLVRQPASPSSKDARSTLNGIGDKQLSGTLPSPALGRVPAGKNERAVGTMLDKASTAHARVEEVRERRARGDNGPLLTGEKLSNAKARERAATIELGKKGIKEGTDSYHEGMQQMRAGKVPSYRDGDGSRLPLSTDPGRRAQQLRMDDSAYQKQGWNSNDGEGGQLPPNQTRAFNAASQHYADSHMTGETAQKQPPTYGANGDGRKGFQIPKVQAAAQAAKGNNYQGPEE